GRTRAGAAPPAAGPGSNRRDEPGRRPVRHDGAPRRRIMTRTAFTAVICLVAVGLSGCGWRGVNSLPLPGTAGGGPGSYVVQAQLPDVTNIQPNSRVRVGD